MVKVAVKEAKAVIFDLFHTLTDLESKWSKIPPTNELLGVDKNQWNNQLLNCSDKRLTGEWQDPFFIIKKMVHAIDPNIPDVKIREVVKLRIRRISDGLENIPKSVIETIISLKNANKKIGLISNLDVMELAGWEKSPLFKLIDEPIFSCKVGFRKPNPHIFELCIKNINLKADECLYVGDGGSNELVVSRQVGMKSVFISGIMKEFRSEKIEEFKKQANYHIESISELW